MRFRLLNLFAILSLAAIFLAAATASTAAASFTWMAVMFAIVFVYRLRQAPRLCRVTYVVEELVANVFFMFWGLVLGLVFGMPLYLRTGWPREPLQAIACAVTAMLAVQLVFPNLFQIHPKADASRESC